MKVLLLNGSPRADGNTYAGLKECADTLEAVGIETEIMQIGMKDIPGCNTCGACGKTGRCIKNDIAVEFIDKMAECDGLIIGTPVYYASPNGSLISMLDRAFHSTNSELWFKPAAAVACARRGGTTASIDVLNKYFTITQMPIVSSTYWNMVHGLVKGESVQDDEGMQTMRNLARNMAWMLRCIEAGKAAGINPPETEKSSRTHFIR